MKDFNKFIKKTLVNFITESAFGLKGVKILLLFDGFGVKFEILAAEFLIKIPRAEQRLSIRKKGAKKQKYFKQ